jgi:hypothetical protein
MHSSMTHGHHDHAPHPTYRIRSMSRGTEGPLLAGEIVDLARIGMLGPKDLIERRPGVWVASVRSPEVRAAMESRRTRGHHLLSSPVAAVALLGLRVVANRVASEERARAELLAIVAQHPAMEVVERAVEMLVADDADGLGDLARRIAAGRAAGRIHGNRPVDAPFALEFRREIPARLARAEWTAFDVMRRQIDGRGGRSMVWPNAWDGRFVVPGALPPLAVDADGHATRAFGRGMHGLAIEQVRAFEQESGDSEDQKTLDLSGIPMGDLDSLPGDIQDVIRRCRRIDLSDTALRSVPAWLFEGKEHVAMLGTPLESLPDVDPAVIDPSLHLVLGKTGIRRIPESWSGCAIQKLDMSGCALDPDALRGAPKCGVLVLDSCGLRAIDGLAASPRVINLSGNPLGHLPPALRGASDTLESMYLDGIGLAELPGWIMEFRSLRDLSLRDNMLAEVALPLGSLPALEEVDLGGNRIASVVPEAFAGRCLRVIRLDGNALRSLPPINYPREVLDLSRNPLEWFPGILNDHSAPGGIARESSAAADPESGPDASAGGGDPDSDRDGAGVEDPALGLMEIVASGTRVRAVPAGFLDLKIRRIDLAGCAELRSLPLNLAASGLLERLDCSGCAALDRFEAPERQPWASWPEARRQALADGMRESSWCTRKAISIDFSGTGFREVPSMLAVAGACPDVELSCDLSGSRVERWPAAATRPNLRSMNLEGTALAELPMLAGYDQLHELKLPHGQLRSLDGLVPCERLSSVSLPALPDEAYPRWLAESSCIDTVRIGGPRFESIPSFVRALPSHASMSLELHDLPAVHLKAGDGDGAGPLPSCTLHLQFARSPVIRIDAGVISSVDRLVFEDVDLVDIAGFPPGCGLRAITFLRCREVRIAGSIMHCTGLESVEFRDVGTVTLPGEVATLPRIGRLSFVDSGVPADVLAHIRRLRPGLCSVE